MSNSNGKDLYYAYHYWGDEEVGEFYLAYSESEAADQHRAMDLPGKEWRGGVKPEVIVRPAH